MVTNQIRGKDLQGQLYSLKGNEPILLDDPQTIWIVQSGSVALFAVSIKNGITQGTRRYLFTLHPEEALFGTASDCIDQHRQLLAVPMGETELLKVDREYFEELVVDGDTRIVSLVEGWVEQINTTLSHITTPAIQVRAAGEARFSLIDGQTLQPEPQAIAWVQIQQGNVHWMGLEELTLDPTSGIFPLSDGIWLEAVGEVQLATQTTSAIRNADILLEGLSQFHTQLLEYINFLEQQETQEELQRLSDRERLNHQVTAEALGELASSLGTQEATFFLEGAPLLVVAGAVGRCLGVKIRPPAKSENLKRVKEPLEAIVRASRLRMRQILLRDNWWEKDCGPLVAYTQEDNRPVALLPVSATRYEIFDPNDRTRHPVDAEIASTLAPVAYMFYRSLPDKVLKANDLFRFAVKNRGRDILIVFLTGIAATLLGMLTLHATAILIDNAIPDSDRGLLLQVGLGLLVAAFGTAVFRLAQGFALLRVETVSDASTQAAVWDRLLNLPVSFFRQYTTGDLQSRVTSISTIRRLLSGTTLITLITGLFSLLNLGLLFYYSWKLALVAVAVAVVVIAVTTLSGMLLVRKVRPLLEIKGSIFGQTVQLINGISKLRVAGAQERGFASWSKNYSRQIKLELSTQNVEDAVVLFNTVMPTVTSGILFWFTIQQLQEAQTTGAIGLTIGTFLAFNSAFGTFIKGATDVSNTVTGALQVVPQWKRAQPILETIPEVDLSKADPGRLIGKIAVDHVTFRYRQDGPLILDNVSLYAEPGEFIALVGGSGSGKSTIFRLLLGFETPEDGTIYYDGQDLSGLDVEAVRRQLGVVLQNGRIMSASIFDNIASGAQITLDEAWEAARMSGFADDVAAMPMSMHTVISEGGGNLSGGQRQRLLIARALALKPRILLFDEATSALDNKTQAIVSESLDKLQVTRIAIAHRLSTIRNANRIYVLQAGRIAQHGTFEELAAVEGLFAQLMARQMA
ncbi:NHLP bacteriocin export ABC transporter permease/ATPase subunit [Nostoc sp. DedQUE09]|uniref:NHLP bacteriocin export ABC transporter permease/ATPase subunit n=1 Tax=Nostoc sp. DedQUE09 TaxID=3075394 RepID=UPI002AD46B56|nr:NHLP bacteriocin export ABC transporter permease/ATPase subunit [Nostoc sp. DedQUE09]MDZ7952376.1 NHLP bacteriocin export ABC transporter permease/ATPase subunit [Nostoc sp. DedQUE09]